MDADEEDFVFFGTPIEREEELASRKKKAVAEASGHLRTLPSWKQEVRDEEGRRRFHGAFTGGFSAGYYNSVGSKEGWAPQTFTSSRKNRAEIKQQSILNFLDDDEKEEIEGQSLGTSTQFDTFGFTASEISRKQAEKDQEKRPSVIPGPVPDELVVPASESIGVKLLLKMGWRRGHSIRDSRTSLYDARREARKALVALSSDHVKEKFADAESAPFDLEDSNELPAADDVIRSSQSTPVYVLNPKQDLHGLGYDPFRRAPEFRERKRSRTSGNKDRDHRKAFSIVASKSGKLAPGFGIGALEELDDEDEDVYSSGFELGNTYIQDIEEPSTLNVETPKRLLSGKENDVLPGFKLASNSDYQMERFGPPTVPQDFVSQHQCSLPSEDYSKLADSPPLEVSSPEDHNLKVLIDGVATLVARCGKLFEDLLREKNQSNPLFNFLTGGNGHDYYVRRLWEERQKRDNHTKMLLDEKFSPSAQKMTAESRGKILGERPLERSSKDLNTSVASADIQLQFQLADTFTKPSAFGEMPEITKPFKDDPSKQDRFEQFLKDKYQGGLRSTQSSGSSNMSEAARALERLDFEAAAEAIQKASGQESQTSAKELMVSAIGAMQFTSGGLEHPTLSEDLLKKKMYPKREEFPWRPSSILCKRFDLIDPFMGRPPPPPRIKSKIDSLIFTVDSVKARNMDDSAPASRDALTASISDNLETNKDISEQEVEVEVPFKNVERPVDLYKAIFSDDSDDEGEDISLHQVKVEPEQKTEAVSSTLNRLIAGDFLESLGKELGLQVPQDLPLSNNKSKDSLPRKEVNSSKGNSRIGPGEDTLSSLPHGNSHWPGTKQNNGSLDNEVILINGNSQSNREVQDYGIPENKSSKSTFDKDDRKIQTPSRTHKNLSSSSSDDLRSRKRSRRHHRSSSTDSDSSSDDKYQRHSRSSGRKEEGSSRPRSSSSRKHSRKHKHRSHNSGSRSSHRAEKDRSEPKRERRKERD